MGYYMGDYGGYGGYYRGDPFWGFLKKAVSWGGKLLGVGGGPSAGKIAEAVTARLPGAIQKVGPIVTRIAKRVPRKVLVGAGAGAAALGAGVAGYKIGASGEFVRRRRMNVCNPRALRRSIRRAQGFARLARRVLRFTSPKMPKGRMYFKSRKKK